MVAFHLLSFCIQSVVRKALIQLWTSDESLPIPEDICLNSIDQYLHLPVRLFVASSGSYNPLTIIEIVERKLDDTHKEYHQEA